MNPINPELGAGEYGALANVVANTMVGYFRGDGPKTCTVMGKNVSYMEVQLVVALILMFAIAFTRQPLTCSVVAALVRALVDSGKMPLAKCTQETWMPGSDTTTWLFAIALPIWAAMCLLILRQIRSATATHVVEATNAPLWRLLHPILAQKAPFSIEVASVLAMYKYTGDWYYLAALVYALVRRGTTAKVRWVIAAVLLVYGHVFTAIAFAILTTKPRKGKMLKILAFLIVVNAFAQPHLVISDARVSKTDWKRDRMVRKWAAQAMILLCLMQIYNNPLLTYRLLTRTKMTTKTSFGKWLLMLIFMSLITGSDAVGRPWVWVDNANLWISGMKSDVGAIVTLLLLPLFTTLFTFKEVILVGVIIVASYLARFYLFLFIRSHFLITRLDLWRRLIIEREQVYTEGSRIRHLREWDEKLKQYLDENTENIGWQYEYSLTRYPSVGQKTIPKTLVLMLILFFLPNVEASCLMEPILYPSFMLIMIVGITFIWCYHFTRKPTPSELDHPYAKNNYNRINQAWEQTMICWGWLLRFIHNNKLFCILTLCLYSLSMADAFNVWRQEKLWYEEITIAGILNLAYTGMSFCIQSTYTGIEILVTKLAWGASISLMDACLLWLVVFFIISIIQKRMPMCNACGVIATMAVLQWGGLVWYYWALVWICQALNLLWFSMGSHPQLPGLLPMAFLATIHPVMKFFLQQHFSGVRIVPMWYYIVFFGTLALEFTPLIAQQTLVIEKDVITGRIIKQYRKNGPLTTLIFGDISATWDAVSQSAKIGTVYEGNRFSNTYYKLKHLNMMVNSARAGLLDGDVETVTDMRASGYVTMNDQFIANCQAVKHNGMVGIIANIHAIYDEKGVLRPDLKYHFPGQNIVTTAQPVVAYAGNDLAVLGPDTELKCAYGVTNAIPATVIVQGYNPDKKPFTKVTTQKTGMTQMDLTLGHSGCAMVNTETGKLCAILWLTSQEAKTAQFIGLNPWILTQKSEIKTWVSQSSLQLEKKKTVAEIADVRNKLQLARAKMLNQDALKKEAISICDKKLKQLEDSLEGKDEKVVAELAMEHKLYLDLAEAVMKEKKTVASNLRLVRTEKEQLLRERNKLAFSDTHLVSQLRQEAKVLNEKLENINKAIQDEVGFKIPEESRMPSHIPKVNWPIIYKDGDDWKTYWSKDECVVSQNPPLNDPATIERAMKETGLQRRAAVRYCSGHLYNKEWAETMLGNAGMEQSTIKAIISWWLGEDRVTCSYCDRKFTCKENHKHSDKCTQMCITDCNRHSEYCSANSYKPNEAVIDGWTYPIINGKIALGHKNHYLCKCCGPHKECITSNKPTKPYDYYRLNGSGDVQWWVRRTCVENLMKQYKDVEVPMPENVSLLDLLAKQNEYKTALESSLSERDRVNDLLDEANQTCDTMVALVEDYKNDNDLKEKQITMAMDKISKLEATVEEMQKENKTKQSAIHQVCDINDTLKREKEILTARCDKLTEILETNKKQHEKDLIGYNKLLKAKTQESALKVKKVETTEKEGVVMTKVHVDKAVDSAQQTSSSDEDMQQSVSKSKRKRDKKKAKLLTKTESEAPSSDWAEDPKEQRVKKVKEKTEKTVESAATFGDKRVVSAFFKIKASVHTTWNNGLECKCHWCICKTSCQCPEKMCIWCNSVEHDTANCELAKKEECLCGKPRTYNEKKHCCWKDGDHCCVCKGEHHPKKCHAVNHRYWTAEKRESPEVFDRVFKKPDFQLAQPDRSVGGPTV